MRWIRVLRLLGVLLLISAAAVGVVFQDQGVLVVVDGGHHVIVNGEPTPPRWHVESVRVMVDWPFMVLVLLVLAGAACLTIPVFWRPRPLKQNAPK
jgi:hypothetical protein